MNQLTEYDLKVIGRFARRYSGMVQSSDLEDVIQDVALSLLEAKTLPTMGAARYAYIRTVVQYKAVDSYRRRKRSDNALTTGDVEEIVRRRADAGRGDASDARMDIVAALREVEVGHMYAVMLHAFGWKHDEIAALAPGLVKSASTSSQIVHRTRKTARRVL